jgi:hypothetical protein
MMSNPSCGRQTYPLLWNHLAPVKAQDQEDNSISAEGQGSRSYVKMECGMEIHFRTGSVALVHFRKHDNETRSLFT